uniref:Fibrinogen C-terminal domain-containing protein n=1 Tax=Denticeps clupeoides TaxID=299321 RepID=A0AAY4ETB1_9TELE
MRDGVVTRSHTNPSSCGKQCTLVRGGPKRGNRGEKRRKLHRVQHGRCSYTFILPEVDSCQQSPDQYGGVNLVQRDAPPAESDSRKLQHLETAMVNNTQWLQKLENYIQENIKTEIVQIHTDAVHNQTATMLEIGTNLLTKTAEQTLKLNIVEAKVMNQTSRIEIQLLENSLSTNKLEKELMMQTSEISKLRDKNSHLENKVLFLESQQRTELEDMKEEKERLQDLVQQQMEAIAALEGQLRAASTNNSALQRQQQQLMSSVHTLIGMVHGGSGPILKEQRFRDCAQVFKAGHNVSGVYHIYVGNMTESIKVYCDMETSGGGWTLFQLRIDGSTDFQKNWNDYKMGFGDPVAEHWLGNEVVHQMTSQAHYSLRVELKDWEGNAPYSQYERFQLASEKQHYRLFLRGYSGTAGQQSSLVSHGTAFSTRDSDNDNCLCKCALMLTGGWWFDACGLSNLNGIYYTVGHNVRKLNGIKWHHFRGPSYSLRSTAMMIRPADF